tara:strand:- start:3349 stop:3945 length:597 start_codon:yes stop_codon:yes gene_type:complete
MSKIDLSKLSQPTPKHRIKHRVQAGRELSYVDARYCMDVLDAVVGPENWSDDYKEVKGLLMCGVSIKVNGAWCTKWDTGTEANFEGEKSIVSDSFKRACVKWGIARDLYPKGSSPKTKKAGGNATPTPTEASSSQGPQPTSAGDYVLEKGKHQGKKLKDVPVKYLKEVLEHPTFESSNPKLYPLFKEVYSKAISKASK